MATWRDGPEYAPAERPDEYALPDAEPLSAPVDSTPEQPAVPRDRPVAFGAPEQAVPLAELAAPPAAPRDPHEAFSVYATLTSLAPTPAPAPDEPSSPARRDPRRTPAQPSVLRGVRSTPAAPRPTTPRAPAQPIMLPEPPQATVPAPPPNFPPPALNQPPIPTSGAWYPPPTRPAPTPSPSLVEMIRAATPGVLIALTVGFFVRPLAVPLLIVAHALSSRVRYRRSHIHTLFVGAESIVAFLSG